MQRRRPQLVKARYVGPTESRGSRIVVRYRGEQAALPFHHAAPDAFLWAIEQAFGLHESQLWRVLSRDRDVKVFVVDGTS